MIHIDVDAAVTVPVNIMPLIDDTDFITRETGVAYNQAGMDLVWNFITSAGVITQTAVTPTTGGDYDWTHVGDGMYKIEIPASGGASINNDSEGTGYFTGICTGVLAWRSPDIVFRAAALNDALIDGGDVLDVSVTELGGVAQSATDLKDFADAGYDPATNKVQGVVLVDTTTTNTDMAGALTTAQNDLDIITGTDGALIDSTNDVYHALIEYTFDDPVDEYTVTWFKNGERVTAGITSPTIQVVKRADGTDLVASTAMTQIGSTGSYKYDESSDVITVDESYLAITAATIDAGSRSFACLIGRTA